MLKFESETQSGPNTARLGTITSTDNTLQTPCFIASTSRGVIPHVTPDLVESSTSVRAAYIALEDFIEKGVNDAPVLSPNLPPHRGSRLRSFTACPDDHLLILSARRTPPVTSPKSNTNRGIAICTSVGFTELLSEDYVEAAKKLGPDILIGLGDIAHGETAGIRRRDKMFGRTEAWIKEITSEIDATTTPPDDEHVPAVFAPVLPVTVDQQKWYLDLLSNELSDSISGLAIYDRACAADVPDALASLPRLSMTEASGPAELLSEVAAGIDMFTVPFVGLATDAGFALDFHLPHGSHEDVDARSPLATDMWLTSHAMDLAPLTTGCTCYTCTKHSRAYMQHLLSAKEMLAWVLLQIHNLHIIHEFFAGVRTSISKGSFTADREVFLRAYEPEMPAKTGAGPRVRGYQYKSEGPNEAKRNAPAFVPYSAAPPPEADAKAEPETDMVGDLGAALPSVNKSS